MEVKRTHPKAFDELELKLKELEGYEGRVGWFPGAEYADTGTSVAYIAAIQELGYGPIPPRPFMRPAATKNQSAWKKVASDGAKQILAGKVSGQDVMEALTATAQGNVQEAIAGVNSPPLSPITLWARYLRKQKGVKITGSIIGQIAAKIHSGEYGPKPPIDDSKPLNDTGRMLATLTHEVISV